MTKALILGVNGQDGSYLADTLLQRHYDVVGIGRDERSRRVIPSERFTYRGLDLTDAEGLRHLVALERPDVVFHVAAVHGAISAGFTYEVAWRAMMAVNVFALHVVLEHARLEAPGMQVVYAGSAKVFPVPLSGVIDEDTPMRATCLYGIGKLAARDLLIQYRSAHGVRGTNLILFNHDSARRPAQFFLPTMAATIRAAQRDPSYKRSVQTLDFLIDWSAADEIMGLVVDTVERGDSSELAVASGRTIEARAFVTALFARHGLDAAAHLIEEQPRRKPMPDFRVRIDRFVAACGRAPQKTPFDIVDEILQAEAGGLGNAPDF